jgi:hypothetical protein
MRVHVLALLVLALCATHALAIPGGEVRVVLDTGQARTFEHKTPLTPSELSKLASPSPFDLKPYLEKAQRALAVRLGYSATIYGERHHTLPENRLVEITVRDQSSRIVHRYRPRARQRSSSR